MSKITIENKKFITVPIVGSNGKERAKWWLWEYLKANNHIATTIRHYPEKITAEIVVREEKEF